jgi:hypothetical protein
MTREQLVKVFPDQRTVHIPTDGKPLAGYDLALADLQKHGGSPSSVSLAARDAKWPSKPNLFARMFGGGKKQNADEEKTPAAPVQVAARTPSVRTSSYTVANTPVPLPVSAPAPVQTSAAAVKLAAVPLPKGRPAHIQTAAVQTVSPETPATIKPSAFRALAALTPNDIIRARGFWRGLPETPAETSAARRRPADAAPADRAVTTASIGPFALPEGYRASGNDYTLAFAGPGEHTPHRPRPVAAAPRQAAIAANMTIATKASADTPTEVQSMVAHGLQVAPDRLNTPWLRAAMLTPSVENFLNTTLLGAPDFTRLSAFMVKPLTCVVMAFSGDPHHGMTHNAFSGSAVNFPATASFARRTTAALH